jgi:hypothetical protein
LVAAEREDDADEPLCENVSGLLCHRGGILCHRVVLWWRRGFLKSGGNRQPLRFRGLRAAREVQEAFL